MTAEASISGSGSGSGNQRARVLSGMRPTGRLHIGHYFGALKNWVALQNNPAYECFFFVADWHALTTDYADTSRVAASTIEIATDWLAVGLEPAKSTLFVQSSVPEHSELNLLLSMITPIGWLERVPTYKEALESFRDRDLHTHGFLGYPVLQTADIVMYGEPGRELIVPVGEDQVSHVELSREIVRRFDSYYALQIDESLFAQPNRRHLRQLWEEFLGDTFTGTPYKDKPVTAEGKADITSRFRNAAQHMGTKNFAAKLAQLRSWTTMPDYLVLSEVLTEPDVMLTPTPRIPGLDGRKMSKSYGNAITLSESDEDIRNKTRVMKTDPARKRRTDPGDPEVCPVFDWHKLVPEEPTDEKRARIDRVSLECRTAGIGCIECKSLMADALIQWIEPIRRRRQEYEQQPERVLKILDDGAKLARPVAQQTMGRVRESVFGWQKTRAGLGAGETSDKNSVQGAPTAR